MKKLMMVAAVAAMAGGAFADTYDPEEIACGNWTQIVLCTDTNDVPFAGMTNYITSISLPTNSILTWKWAKTYNKAFSLNYKDANKNFKAFKTGKHNWDNAGVVDEAGQGCAYWDATTNRWVSLEWTKTQWKDKWFSMSAPRFEVFGNDCDPAKATKAYAALSNAYYTLDDGTNAYANVYAKLLDE